MFSLNLELLSTDYVVASERQSDSFVSPKVSVRTAIMWPIQGNLERRAVNYGQFGSDALRRHVAPYSSDG